MNEASGVCRAETIQRRGWCGRPATVPVVVACVHEHLRESAACPKHAKELATKTYYCTYCFDVDGHKCLIHLLSVSVVSL